MVIRPSRLHGHGVFPSKDHAEGDIVYTLVVPHPSKGGGSCRTEAARMTNHSSSPSMRPVRVGNTVHVIAARPLCPDDECTIDYGEVLPLLRRQPFLSAAGILRETDGVDHLVSDDSHTNLYEQIADIIDGKYMEMEKSASNEGRSSGGDVRMKSLQRLIDMSFMNEDRMSHIGRQLSDGTAPGWLFDALEIALSEEGKGRETPYVTGNWVEIMLSDRAQNRIKDLAQSILESASSMVSLPLWLRNWVFLMPHGREPQWFLEIMIRRMRSDGTLPKFAWHWASSRLRSFGDLVADPMQQELIRSARELMKIRNHEMPWWALEYALDQGWSSLPPAG